MNNTVLSEYNSCLDSAILKYNQAFRCINEINTDKMGQNQVSKRVTKEVLTNLYELVIEKVAYVPREVLKDYEGANYWSNSEMLKNLELKFNYRDKVEDNNDIVQPIPIIVLTDENKKNVLVARKKASALSKKSPEKDKLLLYFGGHVRVEDKLYENNTSQTLFTALSREIQEELGITLNISSINTKPLFIWLKDNERSEKHLAVCFLYIADFSHHKIKLDDYEFVQKTGTSDSGRVFEIASLEIDKFEKWSSIIMKELLDFEGTSSQLDLFY
jgi:predicted NUDIX family phosphoesterase